MIADDGDLIFVKRSIVIPKKGFFRFSRESDVNCADRHRDQNR